MKNAFLPYMAISDSAIQKHKSNLCSPGNVALCEEGIV